MVKGVSTTILLGSLLSDVYDVGIGLKAVDVRLPAGCNTGRKLVLPVLATRRNNIIIVIYSNYIH